MVFVFEGSRVIVTEEDANVIRDDNVKISLMTSSVSRVRRGEDKWRGRDVLIL